MEIGGWNISIKAYLKASLMEGLIRRGYYLDSIFDTSAVDRIHQPPVAPTPSGGPPQMGDFFCLPVILLRHLLGHTRARR